MKASALFIVLLFGINGYSQTSVNAYKYVIVPERFDFLKEDNQYGLNAATQTLLQKKGFEVFLGNSALPVSIAAGNRCNTLRAEVVQRKAMFTTNLTLLLKDCQGNIVYKSKEGRSREKEWAIAYNDALSDAGSSLNGLAYQYDSTLLAQPQQTASTPASTAPAPAPAGSAPVDITGTLYAQVTPNGYQLVDTAPKKVLTLLKTSMQDYFIAESGGWSGIVFKKDNEWFFEHYENSKLRSQKLEIKF